MFTITLFVSAGQWAQIDGKLKVFFFFTYVVTAKFLCSSKVIASGFIGGASGIHGNPVQWGVNAYLILQFINYKSIIIPAIFNLFLIENTTQLIYLPLLFALIDWFIVS